MNRENEGGRIVQEIDAIVIPILSSKLSLNNYYELEHVISLLLDLYVSVSIFMYQS